MHSSDLTKLSIPGFRILSKLGQGAMAQVYLAVQETLERNVALKVMAEALLVDPEFSERFLREAKIIAQLSHPNIVSVYDVGIYQGCHYLSMEYHAGGDLKAKISKGVTLNEGLRIIRQIAAALDYAHSEGYVHRDVKPENILFDRNGNAILTDFGIARSGDAASKMTAVGTIMGTPKYMSPEQAKGEMVDGRSDLYSLGVIFYEMLTGSAPYAADHPLAICQMHVGSPVPQLPKTLAWFQPAILGCMAKLPKDRLRTGHDIIALLDKLTPTEKTKQASGIDGMTLVPIPRSMVESVDFSPLPGHTEVLRRSGDAPYSSPIDAYADSGTIRQEMRQETRQEMETRDVRGELPQRQAIHPSNTGKGGMRGPWWIAAAVVTLVVVVGLKVLLDSRNSPVNKTRDDDTFIRQGEKYSGQGETYSGPLAQDASAVSPANGLPVQPVLDLLRSLSIVAPQTKSLCGSPEPYLLGQRYIGENDSLQAGECFSIRIEVGKQTDLIVFSHSEDGTIYRLIPNKCNAMGLQGVTFTGAEPIQFPLDSKRRLTVIGLDKNPGREWVYAVGVSGEAVKQSVLDRLSAARDVCDAGIVDGNLAKLAVQSVQDELNRLSEEHRGAIQWMARSFEHKLL